ncbi:MAG: transcription elongation factor GreAB [Sphingobacteriaceae bacterium]|nr:transcription elongation factor GreAB [Sphingobacteriaceae bacterium]
MKPIISESVYKTLYNLIIKQKTPEVKQLGEELTKALIVKDNALQKDIVTINSIVEFIDDSVNKPIKMQIVLPEEMNLNQRKISILAPISIALIGFKQGAQFTWKMPSGIKNINILKVINT